MGQMKIRRTDIPDIAYLESDPVMLWTTGVVEFRIDTRDRKFMRDKNEGASMDLTDMHDDFTRQQW